MKRPKPTQKWLGAKRLAKRLKRKAKRLRKVARFGSGKTPKVKIHSSTLLGWLQGKFPKQKVPNSRVITVQIPEKFSFISNPEGVISALIELMPVVEEPDEVTTLIVDHVNMEEHDLAAEQVMATIAQDLDAAYRLAPRPFRFAGRYPTNTAARRFLRAIGIVRLLDVKDQKLQPEEEERLEVFFSHRRPGWEDVVFGHQDRKSTEVMKFVDHINKCLLRNGRRLTPSGIESLSSYTGEVLANAEEHSERGEWILSGYLDNSSEGHVAEIAVISFGKTFAESFLKLDAHSFPMRQVLPYLEAHLRKSFFSPNWEKEDLLALVALQGGISSKSESVENTRGKGTIDLITFFETMHATMHKDDDRASATVCEMAILSGRTHIRFDGTYKLKTDSTGRDVIAFNHANSLEDPPDSKYIKHLKVGFPGTVISIRFGLQTTLTKEVSS